MRSNIWTTKQLDDFVDGCDALNGVNHPDCVDFITNFQLSFDTPVDRRLDPFSEEYFEAQKALHEEVSGRSFNQYDNEQFEVPNNVNAVNPCNVHDLSFTGKHNRTVLNCLMLANLNFGDWILDLGAGWGMSSELMAFCGAKVHAVDINPQFLNLINARKGPRNYTIETTCASFDDFHSTTKFKAALFYESMHHCEKVWETIAHISEFIEDDGCIVFAGEPIGAAHWASWGMRLDPQSVYCMRKYGWFETGFSESFLKDAFLRVGWHLNLFQGVGLDHGYIGYAARKPLTQDEINKVLFNISPPHWPVVL